jgi:hypothetical protein
VITFLGSASLSKNCPVNAVSYSASVIVCVPVGIPDIPSLALIFAVLFFAPTSVE